MARFLMSPNDDEFDDFGYEEENLDLDSEMAEDEDSDDAIDLVPIRETVEIIAVEIPPQEEDEPVVAIIYPPVPPPVAAEPPPVRKPAVRAATTFRSTTGLSFTFLVWMRRTSSRPFTSGLSTST